jgi:hypothetical protein
LLAAATVVCERLEEAQWRYAGSQPVVKSHAWHKPFPCSVQFVRALAWMRGAAGGDRRRSRHIEVFELGPHRSAVYLGATRRKRRTRERPPAFPGIRRGLSGFALKVLSVYTSLHD